MRTYCISPSSGVSSFDFSSLVERSEQFCIKSLDRTQTLVSYNGDKPSFLGSNPDYTRSEMLTILATDEWSSDESI